MFIAVQIGLFKPFLSGEYTNFATARLRHRITAARHSDHRLDSGPVRCRCFDERLILNRRLPVRPPTTTQLTLEALNISGETGYLHLR